MADKKVDHNVNLTEIGSTGLKAYGGFISEEKLRQLAGVKGITTFAEMRDNDDTVGAVFFIIDKLLRNVDWKSTPANDSPAALDEADFVDSCRNDMEHSWADFISEVLSMLVFGWAATEPVYKYRKGMDQTNPSLYSTYDDGRIGWRKIPLRAQETLSKFEQDPDSGEFTHFVQQPPMGNQCIIPMEKLLWFRTISFKNNPLGRSILRNAYRPWYFKKRIEEVEGIGIERDLAGLPVAFVPPELLSSKATPDQKATLAAIQKLVSNIRRDEQEGVVFPLVYDENGKELYKLTLMSTGGTRQFDTNSIITRYSKAIAMTVLADFIFLGQTKVGSYALSSDKTDMFSAGLGTWLKIIADVMNKVAIPKLMKLNGVPRELWPTLEPGDIEKEDVNDFCDNVYKLVGVGALIPDDSVDSKIRTLLGLPQVASDGNVITPLSMLEDKLDNEKKKLEQPKIAGPNNKTNPGIVKTITINRRRK